MIGSITALLGIMFGIGISIVLISSILTNLEEIDQSLKRRLHNRPTPVDQAALSHLQVTRYTPRPRIYRYPDRCPRCGGALRPQADQENVICGFCNTSIQGQGEQ